MIEALKSEDIVNKVGGKFKLSALIQKRMVEIMQGSRPLVDRKRGMTDLELVIQEIVEDKIGIDYEKSDVLRPEDLKNYEVLLCLGGGIACYKVADLASKLVQAGAGVTVAMTEAAKEFIAPLTLQSLTGRPVFTSMWQSTEYYDTRHISLTDRADIMVVAPATANLLAKLSLGIADDLVSTMALAATGACPILLAPAMNTRMWEAQQVVENVARLRRFGAQFVGPDTGRLACGTTGPGRMSEPAEILKVVAGILSQKPPKRAGSN